MKFEWEEVVDDATDHFTTHRAKIFGGWLVRTDEFWRDDFFGCQSESTCFVPDPNHEWVID